MQLSPRTLTPSESVSSPARNTIRLALHCVGPLDLTLLQRAWQLACHEAPGLAGTLRTAGETYVFHPDPGRGGLVRYTDEELAHFRTTAHRTLDELDCVSALEVRSPGRDQHVVSLLVRHSIADGRNALHALSRLWELYTAMAGGNPSPALREPVLAEPLETLYRDRQIPSGTPRQPDPAAPPVYLTGPDWDGQRLSGLRHGTVRLSAQDTELLRRRCSQQAATVHGVLSAAIVLSLSQSRPDLDAFDLTSIVDVRPHVAPPLGPLEGTYALGFSTSHLDMRLHSGIDGIAKVVIENMRADLESGAAQRSSISNADLRSAGAVPTMLSNLGTIPEFAHPDNLIHTDFSAWNEMDLSSAGSPDVLTVYGNMAVAGTFAGRLRMDLFHGNEMFPGDWTQAQVRQIREFLADYLAGKDRP